MNNTAPLTPTVVAIVASIITVIGAALWAWVAFASDGGFGGALAALGAVLTLPISLLVATFVAVLGKSPSRGWFAAKVSAVAFAWSATIASVYLGIVL